MEYNKSINAMTPGDEIEGYYILKSANPKVAANGKPFLTGALSDRTGTMELKVWDYTGPLTAADEGTVVKVRGTVGEYRGTAQFTAARIRQAVQEDPVDVSALVPTAPIDCGAAMEDLRRAAASITDPDYRAMAEAMLEAHGETLASIPAAKSVHHAFLGGLLLGIIEALAQVGSVAMLSVEGYKGKTGYFGGINNCKFKQMVRPGDKLRLECEIIKQKGPVGIGKATATVDGKLAASAELTFMIG